MKVDGTHYRSLWWDAKKDALQIIDQRWLPHEFRTQSVVTLQDFADAIVQMRVRGAPLIGATAAYGVALPTNVDASDAALARAVALYGARLLYTSTSPRDRTRPRMPSSA